MPVKLNPDWQIPVETHLECFEDLIEAGLILRASGVKCYFTKEEAILLQKHNEQHKDIHLVEELELILDNPSKGRAALGFGQQDNYAVGYDQIFRVMDVKQALIINFGDSFLNTSDFIIKKALTAWHC